MGLRLDGDGVAATIGARAVCCFGVVDRGGRDDEGREDGGRFSASDDCGDNDGVVSWAGGRGDTALLEDLDVL